MNFIAGMASELARDDIRRMAAFRHDVFVEMLGWRLDESEPGQELDQFDVPETVYVIARDENDDRVLGTARLLPTTGPYLLADVFPELLHGLPPPRSPAIWELSRFAAVDMNADRTSALSQFSSPVAIELMRVTLAVASQLGAERLVSVSPLGIERLLRRAGFDAHRIARPVVVDGHPIFACMIETESERSLNS